jgi:uncharacterized membrane protein
MVPSHSSKRVIQVGESEPSAGEYEPSSTESSAGYLPISVWKPPADLLIVLIINIATIVAVAVPQFAVAPLRTVIGAVFVLAVPGYAVVSALFPEANERTVAAAGTSGSPSQVNVDDVERIVLSIALSAVIAGISGFGLHLSSFRLRPLIVLAPLTAVTVLATVVAVRRRRQLPAERRFRVSYRISSVVRRTRLGESSAEIVVNGLLVLSIVLASSTLGFALLFPQDGERFTEFYLLAEDETGDLRAAGYPDELAFNETRTVHAAVENHEQRVENYTLLVELHRVKRDDSSATIVESERLSSTTLQLRHNETVVEPVPVTPRMTGNRLRLAFLLYRDAPPENPRISNAYRKTYLWINVSESPSEEGCIPDVREC